MLSETTLQSAINFLRQSDENIPDTEVIEVRDGIILRLCSYAPTGKEVKRKQGELKEVKTRGGYDEDTIASDITDYELSYLPIDFRFGITYECAEFSREKQLHEYSEIKETISQLQTVFFSLYEEEIDEAHKYPDDVEFTLDSFDSDPTWVIHDGVSETVWFYGPIVNLPLLE